MISTALTVIVMSAVLTTMMMVLKTGYSVEQYTEMEQQSRASLELFGQDVRMAKTADWTSQNEVALTIPTDSSGATKAVVYSYDAAKQTFSREDKSTGLTRVLLSGIDQCALNAYKLSSPDPLFDPASTAEVNWISISQDTKQIQLSVTCSRNQILKARTTQKALSARFILRNKKVAI